MPEGDLTAIAVRLPLGALLEGDLTAIAVRLPLGALLEGDLTAIAVRLPLGALLEGDLTAIAVRLPLGALPEYQIFYIGFPIPSTMEVWKTLNLYRLRFRNFWESMNAHQNFIASFMFVILTTLGAKIRVYMPFTPIPFTLQTFFVLSSAMYLRSKWVSFSMGVYLFLGLIGIPVFAGNAAGVSYFIGATGGYLLAFLVVPPFISYIFRKYKYSWKSAFASSFSGAILILLIGSIYLGSYMGNMGEGFIQGFLPFIAVEILKSLGVAGSCKVVFISK